MKLKIETIHSDYEVLSINNSENIFQNVFEAEVFLKQLIENSHSKGYLNAHFKSITYSDTLVYALFDPGNQMKLASLSFQNIESDILKKAGIKSSDYMSTFFSSDNIQNIMGKIVSVYENNGYPFARVELDSLFIKTDTLRASLICHKGNKVMIDSIINKGNLEITPEVLYSFIQLFPGDFYNESLIANITLSVNQHPFLHEKSSPAVRFNENGAVIILNIDKKPVNTFDGLIGFLSDNQNEGKLIVTGELMLSLTNSLQLGETMRLKWKQSGPLSQDLRTFIQFPWLIYIPLGISWDFHLMKKDTSYINIENKLFVFFSKNNTTKTGGYLHFMTSNVVLSSQFLVQNQLSPIFLDMKSSSFGLRITHFKTNNIHNPEKGLIYVLDISAGKKIIIKNNSLQDSLYYNIRLNSTLIKAESDISVFIPIFKSSTIMLKNQSGIINSNQIFENELFRLGGIGNIRGFDENRFSSSTFTVQTIEYRYLFSTNSRIVVFTDFGYIEQKLMNNFIIEHPLSFGTGISFDTNAGLFSLFYAFGKTQNQNFDLKSSKIHFGYLIVF